MFGKYLDFLKYFMGNIDKYFMEQAPYIKCKMGCAKCCSNGDYPFSKIEIDLLKIGFNRLPSDKKELILDKIREIKENKDNFNGEGRFTYQCPFLIDNMCSVYEFRGIICRTFGLIYIHEGGKMQIPFCAYDGLNYSDVLDKEKNILSNEKMKECGFEVEPKAYNIHYDFVTSERVGSAFGFEFGQRASLIDLLVQDSTFYKKK